MMNEKDELKLLSALLKGYESDKTPFLFTKLGKLLCWVATVIALLTIKKSFEASYINIWVLLVSLLFIGAAIGFLAVYEQSYKGSPITKQYLDIDKIRARIRELQT